MVYNIAERESSMNNMKLESSTESTCQSQYEIQRNWFNKQRTISRKPVRNEEMISVTVLGHIISTRKLVIESSSFELVSKTNLLKNLMKAILTDIIYIFTSYALNDLQYVGLKFLVTAWQFPLSRRLCISIRRFISTKWCLTSLYLTRLVVFACYIYRQMGTCY